MVKPEVNIRNARIVNEDRIGKDGVPYPYLLGFISSHHRLIPSASQMKDYLVQTSRILKREGDKVETLNTIYNVTSWTISPSTENEAVVP